MLTEEMRSFATLEHGAFFAEAMVPRDGFTWVTGQQVDRHRLGKEGRFLVAVAEAENRPPSIGRAADSLAPFARLDLVPTLRSCPLDEDGILKVANRFGFLGHPATVRLSDDRGVPGETLEAWRSALIRFRMLVNLADAVTEGKAGSLKHFVTWADDDSWVRVLINDDEGELRPWQAERVKSEHPSQLLGDGRWTMAWTFSEAGGTAPAQLRRWRNNRYAGPIQAFVAREVDQSLKACVHVRLIADVRRRGVLMTRLAVDHLIGVAFVRLHLQLAGREGASSGKPCAWSGCTALVPGRRRYCDDHRDEAARDRKRRAWHNNPEWNTRRRGSTQTTLD